MLIYSFGFLFLCSCVPALGTQIKDKWLITNDLSFYSFKNVPVLFPQSSDLGVF